MPNMMVDFGSGPNGAMISGKWVNKLTGQVINVRDSFMDGDNLIIMSDKGQINGTDFTNLYIQASDEIYDKSGKVIDTKPLSKSELIDEEEQKLVAAANKELLSKPLGSSNTNSRPATPIKNYDLIDKIFSKSSWNPEIDVNIADAKNFPTKELKMLVDFFDVNETEIGEYIYDKLITKDLLIGKITEFLDKTMK